MSGEVSPDCPLRGASVTLRTDLPSKARPITRVDLLLRREARGRLRLLAFGLFACAVYLALVFWATRSAPPPVLFLMLLAFAFGCGMTPFFAVWLVALLTTDWIGPNAGRAVRWVGAAVSIGLLWLAGANLDLRVDPFAAIAVATVPLVIAAGVLIALLIAVVIYVVFGKKETRIDGHVIVCSACEYDMTGTPIADRCPECGREFDANKARRVASQ